MEVMRFMSLSTLTSKAPSGTNAKDDAVSSGRGADLVDSDFTHLKVATSDDRTTPVGEVQIVMIGSSAHARQAHPNCTTRHLH